MSHPQAPSVPRSPGPPPVQDPNRLTNAEAEQYVSKRSIFRTLFKSHHENKITTGKDLEIKREYSYNEKPIAFWRRLQYQKGVWENVDII